MFKVRNLRAELRASVMKSTDHTWFAVTAPAAAGAPYGASVHACAAVPVSPQHTAGTPAYDSPASLRAAAGSGDGGTRTGAELPPAREAAPAVAGPHTSAFDTDTSP